MMQTKQAFDKYFRSIFEMLKTLLAKYNIFHCEPFDEWKSKAKKWDRREKT